MRPPPGVRGVNEAADGSAGANAGEMAAVIVSLAVLVTVAVWWTFSHGATLFYGDAESHLNISRGLIDSRTPGYELLGTVWLPVIHLLCLPFAMNDGLWRSGLAGALPVAACFVIAGSSFYLVARGIYANRAAAAITLACFALNPNVLYLAAIPMTEIVFFAELFTIILAVLHFQKTGARRWLVAVVVVSWAMSLTRYDGWFLLPFIGVWLAIVAQPAERWRVFFAVEAAMALAPIYWIAHNWWETGNALDFINGPYSPVAIQGGKPYPGLGDWLAAVHYYGTASAMCAGAGLIALALAGICVLRKQRAAWIPILFLLLTPAFYVWGMHSTGGTPIYVPSLWPFSYYNTRYGLACVPLCAMAAGALAATIHARAGRWTWAIPVVAVLPWVSMPSPASWVCWKESDINSRDRRAWSAAAVNVMRAEYRPGQGILSSAGDVTGIYRLAGIPLAETINIGNGPMWFLASTRPDLYHPALWLIRQSNDSLEHAVSKSHPPYRDVVSFHTTRFSPNLLIGRRELR